LYEDIAGALYTLEGRAGMSKGQFQQFMQTLQVPLPKYVLPNPTSTEINLYCRTGPISSPLNDRVFSVFNIQPKRSGKVNLEDVIHVFSVFSSENLDEKLKCTDKFLLQQVRLTCIITVVSFRGFDINHTGRVTYTEMQNTLKALCPVVYPGEKYELLHVFVSEGINHHSR